MQFPLYPYGPMYCCGCPEAAPPPPPPLPPLCQKATPEVIFRIQGSTGAPSSSMTRGSSRKSLPDPVSSSTAALLFLLATLDPALIWMFATTARGEFLLGLHSSVAPRLAFAFVGVLGNCKRLKCERNLIRDPKLLSPRSLSPTPIQTPLDGVEGSVCRVLP